MKKEVLFINQAPETKYPTFQQVVPTQDEEGHWYVIPVELYDDFERDLEDEEMTESGKFDEIYGEYKTGGGLDLKKFYIEI